MRLCLHEPCVLLVRRLPRCVYCFSQVASSIAVACLLETFTKQIDNLFLPLYFAGALLLFSAPA